jgi:hypothetical protein
MDGSRRLRSRGPSRQTDALVRTTKIEPSPPTSTAAGGDASVTRRLPTALWVVLALLTAAEGLHEATGLGAPDTLFTDWIHDGLQFAAAGLVIARGLTRTKDSTAWLVLGAGAATWAVADALWSILYTNDPTAPYPSASDAFWLAWYPLTVVGIALLVRAHLPRFELHRWMDGLAVMLIVLTAGSALLIQPVADQTHDTTWATFVAFSYPVMDVLLIGGILGVYGLLGWRPGRMWQLLGVGIATMTIADMVYAVQQAGGSKLDENYDFVWTAGALLIAAAAWSRTPRPDAQRAVYGWRVIALPLASQLLAAGIQVYGLFHTIGRSERIVTLAVLMIASLQIIVSRPRRPG